MRQIFFLFVNNGNILAKAAAPSGINKAEAAEELAGKFLEKTSLGVKVCRDAFYQCADTTEFDGEIQWRNLSQR